MIRKKHNICIFVLSLLFFLCLTPMSLSASENISDGYLFKLAENSLDAVGSSSLTDNPQICPVSPADQLYHADSLSAIDHFADKDQIVYIEPDYTAELYDTDFSLSEETALTSDPYAAEQWYLSALGLPPLWEKGIEGSDSTVIAVIDSGMTPGLEDIDYSRILTGKNVLNDTTDVTDDVWHGTFVTGILASVKNNSLGITGLLSEPRILPIKSFSGNTTLYSNIIKGIHYAAEQKKRYTASGGASGANICVINLSLGGTAPSQALKEACDAAMDLGILLVCAAGNKGTSAASYPAQYTMGVGSVGQSLTPSSFSQSLSDDFSEGFLNKVWVCAPGENIVSYGRQADADGSFILKKNGTSFACPMVSALGAVLKAADDHLTQETFMEILKDSSTYLAGAALPIGGQDRKCGYGLVNFEHAYDLLCTRDKNGHRYTVTGITPSSCIQTGSCTRQCSICGHIQVTALPLSQHQYQSTVIAPTWSSNGYTLHSCTVCRQFYQDSFTPHFTLTAPQIYSLENTASGVSLKWSDTEGAFGYSIYRRKGSGWKKAAEVSSAFWTDRSVKNGTRYTYRIQAVRPDQKSAYSASAVIYRLSPVKIKKVQKKSSRSLFLRYTKNAKAAGYKIQYASNKNFKHAKTLWVRKRNTLEKTISKLSRGKKYYLRVAAYKTSGGINDYSCWTKTSFRL